MGACECVGVIRDIEIIDIRGSGNNTLKLNLNDLLDASTSTNILKVLGDSGDTVTISDFVKTGFVLCLRLLNY
jgi:hypothetical protein